MSRLEVKDLVSERRVDGAMVFLGERFIGSSALFLLFVAWHAMTHDSYFCVGNAKMP